MTSTSGRTDVMDNDVKLGRNSEQILIAEKQSSRKRNNAKRGGVKRRMSSLAYHQQQYMLMRGGHPGGRPLHPTGTNTPQRVVPIRYPNVSGPPHLFPPQKFGFFNEATPSIHPGHPGSEKRIYEGPPKPRLMMEEQGRTRQKSAPKPPKLLFSSGRGDIELNDRPVSGPTLEVRGNKSNGPNEQQAGMNELFAKMIWKKLDMIQSPMRLNRLHTEIMNLLQQAIAEETGK
uniref:BESS domain-containing protein n=1 Tax=Elaeophora elaphi TaxID=1147741 RepID=A0A0R3S2Z7_9BILA